MSISSGQGDHGETRVADGRKISKANIQIEVLGSFDEFNSQLGICRSFLREVPQGKLILPQLLQTQKDIFILGARIAGSTKTIFSAEKILQVENWTKDAENVLPKMTNFILPGGNIAAAYLHNARSVCRRLERRLIELAQADTKNDGHHLVDDVARVYLNRLSDLLFCWARLINLKTETPEILWSTAK